MREELIKRLVRMIRAYNLSYSAFNEIVSQARREAGLHASKRRKAEKRVGSWDEWRTFYRVLCTNYPATHRLMFRLMLHMGLRRNEVCSILVSDIDLEPWRSTLFARRKRGEDKTFVIPSVIEEHLRIYMETIKGQVWLFESDQINHKPYSGRAIAKFFQRIRENNNLSDDLHPHGLRHFLVQFLESEQWNDRQIAAVTGHELRNNTSIYRSGSSEFIREMYNVAAAKLETLMTK